MWNTVGEVRTNSYGRLYTDVQVLDDQLELIYNSFERTQDVVKKTCRKRWIIGANGQRESGKSVLAAWHDDDDDDCS